MKIHHILLSTLAALTAAMLTACGSGARNGGNGDVARGDTLTSEASLLTMVDCGGYIVADVADPWNEGARLARYILVDSAAQLPASLPEGTVLRTPVDNLVVYSSVYAEALKETGAIERITGVADASYFKTPEIVAGLASGAVTDIGNSMAPTVEKIVALKPGAILASPYQNAGHGAIESLGVPIIECADYMETSPLARAEWVKLFGALTGTLDRADSLYRAVSGQYNALKTSAPRGADAPSVITEQLTDGVWYMPGGQSYMARLIADAGGAYPWADNTSSGSLQLDFPTVFDRAHDADIWLIRTYGSDLTLDGLRRTYAPNAEFKAFREGNVYICNSAETAIFDDLAFHPERVLREYITIFTRPDSIANLRYFHRAR